MGTSDAHIEAFRPLFSDRAEARRPSSSSFIRAGLLGRRDGILQAAYAPSSARTERFRIVPRALHR